MMKRKAVSILILLTVIFFAQIAPTQFIPLAYSDGEDWLTGWDYRKSHIIDGSSAGSQTDYQMKVRVFYDYSFPDGRFYNMSARKATVTGNPTSMHGFSVLHNSSILEVNMVIDGASRKYLAYCAHEPGVADEISLFYSDDLDGNWTAFSGNPIVSGATNELSSPTAVMVGGTIHMFIDNMDASTIERWTSPDGENFTKIEDILGPLTDLSHTCDIWLNPNDDKYYLYWRRGPGDVGGAAIMARNSSDITALAIASDTIVTTVDPAFPTIMYRDGKYWLVTEWLGPNGDWQVRARSSDSPTSGFTYVDDSPMLTLDEACPRISISPDGTKVYLYTNRDGANWFQDTREVFDTSLRNSDVDLDTKSETDFGDIRFTASDGDTLLPIWIEEKVNSDYSDFWFSSTVPEDPDSATIYIYYGKTGESTTSNGDSVFPELFDDFNRANNNTVGNGWTESENAVGDISIDTNRLKEIGTAAQHISCTKGYTSPQTLYRIQGKWELAQSNIDKLINTLLFSGVDRSAFNARNDARIDYLNNVDWQDGTSYVASTEYSFEIEINETANDATYYFDSVLVKADQTYYNGVDDPNEFQSRIVINNVGTQYLDFVFLRRYISPEPKQGDWGSEEEYSAPSSNNDPTVTSFVISDLSDNSLFKTLWYRPVMVVDDEDGLSTIGTSYFSFETDYGWHNVSYNYQTDVFAVPEGGGRIIVANGYTESSGTSLTINFYLMLLEPIDVKNDVDVYCRVTDTSSGDSDWSLEQSNYFNILDYVEDIGGSTGWTPTETPAEEPQEVWIDSDDDGIPNWDDPDVDGDGIPNEYDPDIDGDDIPNNLDPEPFIPEGEESKSKPVLISFRAPNGRLIEIINPLYYLKPYQKIIIPFIFILLALMLYSIYRNRQKTSLDTRVASKTTNLRGRNVSR